MPAVGGNDHLRALAFQNGGAEREGLHLSAVLRKMQRDRRAGIIVPDLDRIGDPMPVRALAFFQEIIDRRGMAALAAGLVTESLVVKTALGMWLQPQFTNDRLRRYIGCHQKLSLRVRISAKTSASVALSRPRYLRMPGSATRI
ncbi:hypothetical protein D3C80_1132520 [compost metagenome]